MLHLSTEREYQHERLETLKNLSLPLSLCYIYFFLALSLRNQVLKGSHPDSAEKMKKKKKKLKKIQGQKMMRKRSWSSEKIRGVMGKQEAETPRILWGWGVKV